MRVSQALEDTHRRKIFVIGYSQSGKSTRIACICDQLKEAFSYMDKVAIKPSYGDQISITIGSQSRHIAPRYRGIMLREGEIDFVSVDYTGQDHQAAYYFLKKIYEIIENIKNQKEREGAKEISEDIKKIFESIREVSRRVISVFESTGTGLDVKELNKIIIDPFYCFRDIASKYKINLDLSYLDVVKSIVRMMITRGGEEFIEDLSSYNKPGEAIKYLEEYLREKFKIIGLGELPSLRVVELNRILCRIDTLTTNIEDDKNYRTVGTGTTRYGWLKDCDISNNIKIERIGEYGWLRGIITGPLLAYLFLGMLIDSWATIILMPADFDKWYTQLKKIYIHIVDKDKKDEGQKDEISKEKEIKNTMIEYIKRFTKLDTEIDNVIKKLCSGLIYQYMYENKLDIHNIDIDNVIESICGNLCEDIAKNKDEYATENEDVRKYVCDKKLLTLWGEALAKVYHYELINVLLSLYLEYLNSLGDRGIKKVFIFDLTYCENKSFIDGMKAILSSEYLHFRQEEIDYIMRFRNIIKSLTIVKNHNVNIYFVPSTIRGGTHPATVICTPFEAISIICLSEKTQEIIIRDANTGEEIPIQCSSILKRLELDWINMVIQKQTIK